MLSDFVAVVGAAWRLNGGGNEDTLGTMVLLKEEAKRERERVNSGFCGHLSLAVGYLVSLINRERTELYLIEARSGPDRLNGVIDWSVYWRIQGRGTIISLDIIRDGAGSFACNCKRWIVLMDSSFDFEIIVREFVYYSQLNWNKRNFFLYIGVVSEFWITGMKMEFDIPVKIWETRESKIYRVSIFIK